MFIVKEKINNCDGFEYYFDGECYRNEPKTTWLAWWM